MEDRLVDLELRYMQLEQLVSELNNVVYGQQKVIDGMRSELADLRHFVEAIVDPARADKPPHY
mgnify:CR=1 FL=1